jgi:hypothetical protein
LRDSTFQLGEAVFDYGNALVGRGVYVADIGGELGDLNAHALLVAPKPAQELSLHVAGALIDIFALPLELLHQALFQSIEIGFEDGLVLGRV